MLLGKEGLEVVPNLRFGAALIGIEGSAATLLVPQQIYLRTWQRRRHPLGRPPVMIALQSDTVRNAEQALHARGRFGPAIGHVGQMNQAVDTQSEWAALQHLVEGAPYAGTVAEGVGF